MSSISGFGPQTGRTESARGSFGVQAINHNSSDYEAFLIFVLSDIPGIGSIVDGRIWVVILIVVRSDFFTPSWPQASQLGRTMHEGDVIQEARVLRA